MTGEAIFNFLWDFGFTMIRLAGQLWAWLFTPIVPNNLSDGLSFVEWATHTPMPDFMRKTLIDLSYAVGDFFKKTNILSVSPIQLLTGSILVFIVLGITKTFVPKTA